MTDLYWPYPDSPDSCVSASSCSSVSEMSVSPAPSPRQSDAADPETDTDAETKIKAEVKAEPVLTKAEPVSPAASETNANSPAASWSSERLDNADCALRTVTSSVSVHYPPNPYRRPDPYRAPAGRTVRQMLADGARVGLNSMDAEGWTALHRAVRSGDLELVRLLVGHGADFRLADRDGFSPLHMASWAGHSQLVVYLLGLQR
ncbi:protein phosphatase 1 regulatory subunit 12C-like [Amphibalanus amphitrite]|uniref:protein phosphatase 1 regulatory subunit 12C-like n=1 Tax=Amphibalanus amphitrite TaxID=1232801 RepID=UPI001C90BA36|nr:protein phosphatase 1 regulatory subunit 12C-like [Amphibalanus amphitrite]